MQVDIDIVVYAVVAALLLGRLWAVFGSRNNTDIQRPNPFAAPPPRPRSDDAPFSQPKDKDAAPSRMLPPILPPNSLAGGLAQVQTAVPSFDEKAFLQESSAIFSAVVGAYAAGNLSRVSEYLSPELMGHFQQSVDARQNDGMTAQTRIIRIRETEAVAARAEEDRAFVTVRFVSEQENTLSDAQGNLVGGEKGKAEEVIDIWTFAQETKLPTARWVVIATRT